MRVRVAAALAAVASLASCASPHPEMVMMNPRTGAVVGCQVPDELAGSGEFLVSRACVSACTAHGFRLVPGALTQGTDDTPSACLD